MAGAPMALKLYGFNLAVFHAPLPLVSTLVICCHKVGCVRSEHVCCQVCLFFNHFGGKIRSLVNLEADDSLSGDKFPFLQICDDFRVWV